MSYLIPLYSNKYLIIWLDYLEKVYLVNYLSMDLTPSVTVYGYSTQQIQV